MTNFGCHLNVDLQQRGIEYSQLFSRHQALRPAIMERIPALERTAQTEQGLINGGSVSNGDDELLMDDLNPYPSRQNNQTNQSKESVRFVFTIKMTPC